QEYNGLRNGWIETRQQWMSEPERAYKYQTSQLLLAIRVVNRETADNQTPPAIDPVSGDGPPDFSSPEVQRERLVRQRTLSADEALEERYDEQARALFQRLYEEALANYQRYIDQSAHAYVAACRSQQFVRIEQHDYDGANRPSGLAYCQTMARCLEGGISEAPPPQDKDSHTQNPPADTGPTASLWSDWLKNPQSPVYRALLVRDKKLLADLLPSFNAETDESEWNDTEKLYSTIVALIGSDEFKHSVRPHLQLAMAQLLGALNSAAARLQPALSPAVARVVSRLNSAVQLLYNGVHLTQLKVTMTLGQYYALQSEYLRSLQQKAADAIDRTWDSAKDKLGEIDHEARQARKQVRPIIQNGLLSLAVLHPKIADHTVTISVWVEGKVTELQDSLMRQANLGVDHLGRSAHALLVNVTVGLGTLDPQTRKLLQGLKVSTQQAAHWVRTGFTGLRGVATSSELLLAIGGLYFASDSLKKNIEEAEKAIGDKSDEARLALYGSSLGVLGGGVEIVGIALEKGAEQAQKIGGLSARASAAAKATAHAGNIVIRVGGSISAVSGLYDATQAGFAASRSLKGGDTSASNLYRAAAVVSGAGAVAGIWAAVGSSALLGPLGVAILLSLSGYAFLKWAEGQESTPLERWARRCYFGYHNETPPIHWNKPEHAAQAVAELNAATMGIQAGVNFSLRLVETDSPGNMGKSSAILRRQLEYRLVLPLFDAERSAYRWSLTVHRHGDGAADQHLGGEVVAQGNLNPPELATPASKRQTALAAPKLPKKPDYQASSTTPTLNIRTVTSADARTLQIKDIKGAIELLPDSRRHNIEAATLSLTYWPNRDILDAYAELTLMDHQ
ncbi:T6SS effector BTH_I2691 family protein, partial [Pseudomonas sp. FSL R10-2189]|uniref:T6SS effector BTH_I2691 family protein n=1 Tax=Pseudomonas sp. FSL R10-2189 TaxID=2662199 RepID=UPI0015B73E53